MLDAVGMVVVASFGFLGIFHSRRQDIATNPSSKITDRIGKLWDIAHQGMRENRFLRAEKALLTILKIDERNAAAYNRLGILYAKQKEYRDAIDCFEIASSIEATSSSLHNLGLIYYETENYQKAAIAFEQALKLEDDSAARHVAYAKVQEKLGNEKMFFTALMRAVDLEPNKESLMLLHKAYVDRDMQEDAEQTAKRLEKLIVKSGKSKRMTRTARRVS